MSGSRAPWRARPPRALLVPLLAALLGATAAARPDEPASGADQPAPAVFPRVTDLSGPGWTLWRDHAADWEHEPPVAPGTPLAALPVRPPSGGWEALDAGTPVSVPDTLEALFGPDEPDPRGVSWWSRDLAVPAALLEAPDDWVVRLRFHAVGRRAEVFVNRALVGRDDVGNSAFDVHLPVRDLLRPQNRLDVRVTDPGGNFGWQDEDAQRWGAAAVPAAHGFGGLLARVELLLLPARHVHDLWVESGPPRAPARLHLTLAPGTGDTLAPGTGDTPAPADDRVLAPDDPARPPSLPLRVRVLDTEQPAAAPLVDLRMELALPPGDAPFEHVLELPLGDAPRWSPEDPHLLAALVEFDHDRVLQTFGLRHFRVVGLGDDARLELDGRPRLLRSAISWGYWPVTGAIPSEELARRQVLAAQQLGLDMLNHHRNAPHPRLLPWHDRLGLLAYVEPGGYASVGGDELAFALARERWLRLVRRARRHPSVVVANMINEAKQPPGERGRRDLADAQALAPHLLLTYTSAWAADDAPELSLHARPGEPGLHTEGWWDQHHAPGPGVWRDAFWNGPDDHLRRVTDREQVVFFGEDGAIGSPPRLPSLVAEWGPRLGWDGASYAARLAAWRDDLAGHGWDADDAELERIFRGLGDNAYVYHARVLENLRLDGVADGYVINGWDDQKGENHSGLVDALRRPKGHATELARAAEPRLLAVKPRASVLQVRPVHDGARLPATLVVDVGLHDTTGLAGPHRLLLRARQFERGVLAEVEREVQLTGDGAPQWLLAEHALELPADPGWIQLDAALLTADGAERARRTERVFAVDGRHRAVPPGGALLDDGRRRLTRYFRETRDVNLPRASEGQPALDWVVVADLDPEPGELVPPSAFRQGLAPDAPPGLRRELFAGAGFERLVEQGVDEQIRVLHDPADPPAGLAPPFTLRWTGALVPPETGTYRFSVITAGGVRLRVGGALQLERWPDERPDVVHGALVRLEAGVPVPLELEYQQLHEASRVNLEWTRPRAALGLRHLADDLLRRVHDDGTTLVVLSHADAWARLLERAGALGPVRRLKMERYWLGGGFFARPHPMLAGLPALGALGTPWQELVHYGNPLYGLDAVGLRRVIGTTSDHQLELGTALGWLRHGEGRIVLSCFDVMPSLEKGPGAADLVRHLVQNLLEWAASDG